MIFVFDWGYKTQNRIGPVAREDIPFKVLPDFVDLIRVRFWFRAFFIPTIPTRTQYFFISEKDAVIVEITKSDFQKYKPLAELNNKVVLGSISEDEYEAKRRNLNFD